MRSQWPPELTTTVNEQNEQAVGFYKKVGFKVTGRSEVDDLGKPYPLLNLAYVGGVGGFFSHPGGLNFRFRTHQW